MEVIDGDDGGTENASILIREDTMSVDLSQLLSLDPLEKLRIISALEESLVAKGPIQLSPAQIEELRRRKRELEANPESAISWDVIERYLDADPE